MRGHLRQRSKGSWQVVVEAPRSGRAPALLVVASGLELQIVEAAKYDPASKCLKALCLAYYSDSLSSCAA